MAEDRCVICNEIIPEGRQVCPICERKAFMATYGVPPIHDESNIRQFKFTIYGNPITKKNSSQIVQNRTTGRWFIAPSAQYKKYCKECVKQIRNGWTDRPKEPIDYPVRVTYLFYKESRRLCDDLNHSAALDDILVQAGVLADDNRDIIESHDGTRVFWDKQNPRVEITITEMPEWKRWKDG